MNTSITIIGHGRLGQLLEKTLTKAGYDQISILKKEDIIVFLNDYILIAVPDRSVGTVINEIKSSGLNLKGKTIAHSSGVLGLDELKSLSEQKVSIGCVHPLMAITESSETFDGITFDICGDNTFIKKITPLIKDIGANYLVVDEREKVKLHAAAAITSNYLVTLMALAEDIFEQSNFKKDQLKKALLPLMKSAIGNMENQATEKALTGPIIRGDVDTIRQHLVLFSDQPELKSMYVHLGQETLRLLGNNLAEDKKFAIQKLLNEA